ncbi:Membrane-anchored ribosome-binding protein, inhibits growth in stationary phase, ElaB/YqjD/DUF883 family [Palleronia salina]|uniref:Membrane-anchored ribosome-binding protein, inhibits growth in stationary phase, ElaB/YqjD/DUF883 family n=2 Tax=Palleronia TaxID=315422 RepID=A0A1M6CL89_9RHOB|nr:MULTISPECIES: DUF883 family protein [Palleronia]SEN22180.1 Membrane-anchored ribosome-binding protein, inhibits growth in stationary phase, ElaB/YqjD/DUF883 family [Palleronia pelagia]SHI61729.1 Membrane-anchored ribosome-binding protein, inhibits growth in stationary phase, ElaB/YqjD/DUF883 family [Palleronia salina]
MVENTNKPEPSTEELSRQVELLKGDIARLTDTIKDMGVAKGRAYSDEARRRANAMRSEAEHKVDEVEEYVRENPATALGIAALVGLIVGFLTRR